MNLIDVKSVSNKIGSMNLYFIYSCNKLISNSRVFLWLKSYESIHDHSMGRIYFSSDIRLIIVRNYL